MVVVLTLFHRGGNRNSELFKEVTQHSSLQKGTWIQTLPCEVEISALRGQIVLPILVAS